MNVSKLKNTLNVAVYYLNPNLFQEHESNKGEIKITNISLGAEGLFRCEVSGDGPAFFTDYGVANMKVVGKLDL